MRTALALALAGCHHDPDLPEDLGDRVATVVGGWEDESGVWPSWGNIAWASDGRELYYREEPEGCAPPCRGIRAVDVETTESRLVVGDLWQILERLDSEGCSRFVVTDVTKDGTLTGPNLDLLEGVAECTDAPVIASGGVSSLDDLRAIATLADSGVEGAIVGKALYAGRFTLPQALEAVRG